MKPFSVVGVVAQPLRGRDSAEPFHGGRMVDVGGIKKADQDVDVEQPDHSSSARLRTNSLVTVIAPGRWIHTGIPS